MSEAELHCWPAGCRARSGPPPRRGELRVPLPVGLRLRRRRRRRHRPRRGGRRRDQRRVRRVHRDRLGLRRGRARSPGAGSRAAPTAGRGPGSCAGAGSPTPGLPGSCATRPTPGRTCSGGAAPARSSHPDGSVRSSVTELPRDQWEVLIPDHHPGYITWEDYLANEAKLAANRTNAGARPPREGHRAVPGHRVLRRAAAARCRSATTGRATRATSAPTPAPTTSPRRLPVGRAPTPSMTRSPPRCWPRSSPTQLALALAAADEVTARRAAVGPRRGAGRRARPLRRRPRRAGLPGLRAGEPAGRPQPGGPLGDQPGRPRRRRGRAGRQRSRPSPRCPAPAELAATVADLPALWSAPDHQRQGPQAAAAHPARRRHPHPVDTGPASSPVGLRWNSGASQQVQVTTAAAPSS